MTIETAITIGAIGLLIALSSFFSGSETALTRGLPPAHPPSGGGPGTGARARLPRLTDDRERLIGAILLGNNAVNILASALATSVLISVVGDAGVAYATIGMTFVILVFAEVLPKTYAIRDADRFALRVAPALGPIVWLLSPVVGAVRLVVSAMLGAAGRLPGAEDGKRRRGGAARHHRPAGAGRRDGQARARHAPQHSRSRRGRGRRGHDPHRKTMEMIDAGAAPADILDQVVRSPYTRLPVWQGEPDNIVGVLHAKDLLQAVHASLDDLDRLDVMAIVTAPWFVPETTPPRGAARRLPRASCAFRAHRRRVRLADGPRDPRRYHRGDRGRDRGRARYRARRGGGAAGRFAPDPRNGPRSAISTGPTTGIFPTRRRRRSRASC